MAHSRNQNASPFSGLPALLVAITVLALCAPGLAEDLMPVTDWSNWPHSYSALLNEKIIFPVDQSLWKMKIDTTHQLFVDDHLVAATENLHRQFHEAVKHPANPVLDYVHGGYIYPDPEGGYRFYYTYYRLAENGKNIVAIRLARSDDGVRWELPDLNICEIDQEQQEQQRDTHSYLSYNFSREAVGKHNNVLIPRAMLHGVFHEPDAADPNEQWKAVVRDYNVKRGKLKSPFVEEKPERNPYVYAMNVLYTSRDGLHWTRKAEILPQMVGGQHFLNTKQPDTFPIGIGDVLRIRWDGQLKKYIAHTKLAIGPDWRFDPVYEARAVAWSESDDLIHWSSPRVYAYPDGEDAKLPGMFGIYEADGFGYESMWLGCLSMITYTGGDKAQDKKDSWIRLAGSRDGRHWYYLGHREPIIRAGQQGAWDSRYLRMANLATTGGPVERDGQLWFYYWGRAEGAYPKHHLYLGIATLRKDGFASLNAGKQKGTIVTRPLIFEGRGRLLINAEASAAGYVKASVLEEDGSKIVGFTSDTCTGIQSDVLRGELSWANGKTLAALKDRHIRIVFHLKNTKLYSFWIE